MVQLQTAFNSQVNNQTMDDYTALPAGKYICSIIKSEYAKTKKRDGTYLKVTLKILEGSLKGRTIFENLNLINPSEVAVEIANKKLNTICAACNKMNVQDSVELHGIPMEVSVKLKPATNTDPESNEIAMYSAYNNTAQVQQQQPIQQTQQPLNTQLNQQQVQQQPNQQVQQPNQQVQQTQQQTQPVNNTPDINIVTQPNNTVTQPVQNTQQTQQPVAGTTEKLPWE
ncbi:MAG: DUF669 domain-containing protein [Candidatus Humimicrobiaceae bacterium]